MSLKESIPVQVPMETARFVEHLLSESNICRFIGQQIDRIVRVLAGHLRTCI